MNCNWKKLIAILAVVMLLSAICVTPAHADSPSAYFQRSRAFVGAALAALNITLQSTTMSAQSLLEYSADPMNVVYTYTDAWQDRPEIQIWPDYTIIDGQKYTDVWISNEAAEKFRVNAFDFKTAYAITSNSQGNIAEGIGHIDDVPLFDIDGVNKSQNMIISDIGKFDHGGYTSEWSGGEGPSSYKTYGLKLTSPNGYSQQSSSIRVYSDQKRAVRFRDAGGGYWIYEGGALNSSGTTISPSVNIPVQSTTLDLTPFDYDYVSRDIPANLPLPVDTGMMIRVPSDDGQGNNYFNQFLTDNPEFNQGEPVTIDVNLDPDIMTKLDDLIDIIAPIIPIINNQIGDIQFIENHEAPAPVPDTPIVDATVPQVINPIINEITNYGDQITEQIPQIIETIPNITDICNNIDTAPYNDIDTGIDHLPSFFLPFITDLRSALGIWHYVTEWLAQISTTFAFITGCLVGTSIMTPIYAAIAGFMCIKIYRRMTG